VVDGDDRQPLPQSIRDHIRGGVQSSVSRDEGLLGPDVVIDEDRIVDYIQVGNEAEALEIAVMEAAPIAGETLTEAGNANLLPGYVSIAAVEHESRDTPPTPRGSARIEANELLTVHSAAGTGPELMDTFGRCGDQTA